MLDSLVKIIRWVLLDTPYLGAYPATVAAQWPDGTLDLTVDDPRLRARGLQRVTVRYGLPETSAAVEIGTACLLEFDGGDPTAPRVTAWGYRENSAVLRIGSDSRPVAREADLVAVSLGPGTMITCIAISPSANVLAAIASTGAATPPPWDPATNPIPTLINIQIATDAAGQPYGADVFGRIRATQTKVTA
jgi:hypothetical protein